MGAGLVLEGGRWMTQEEMIEAMGDGDMEAFHLFYQDTARPVYSFIPVSYTHLSAVEAGDSAWNT